MLWWIDVPINLQMLKPVSYNFHSYTTKLQIWFSSDATYFLNESSAAFINRKPVTQT